jgi:hypothetical protein
MNVRVRVWAAAALVSLLSTLAATAARLDRASAGLIGNYESYGSSAKTFEALDTAPGLAAVMSRWDGAAPDAFTVRWRGVIYVPSDGPYTFATRADGETTIFLDGRIILENGWDQPGQTVRQAVRPDSGLHALNINYRHNHGPLHLEVLWARGDAPLEPIPAWVLRNRRTSWERVVVARGLPTLLAVLEWMAVVLVVIACAATAWPLLFQIPGARTCWGAPRALGWIVAGSTLLNAIGIFWGIGRGWGVLELTPSYLGEALGKHFANGWWDAYPPAHFFVLTIATSPVLVLDWLGRLSDYDTYWAAALVTARVVSLVMAAGTLVAIYFSGSYVFGRRAGLFAAGIFALAAPFVYFAKMANVDVPYVFWFALSLVFYVRLIDGDRLRDYLGIAVTAALAVGTKDQAYGLYVAMPVVLLFSKGLNRKMLAAGAVSATALVLVDNVVFNFSGFLAHFNFVVGPGNTMYRVYAPTLAGRMALLKTTLGLLKLAWGWPLSLACLAGVAMGAAAKPTRRATIWLFAPVASYYLTFINVILYVYDRFTLPMTLVLAVFGGLAIDRLIAATSARRVSVAIVGAAFAYTVLYSSMVDVLMLRDSRYTAERWLDMQTLTPPDDIVASNVLPAYLPRVDAYKYADVESTLDLQMAQPKFFILNVDYLRGQAPDSPVGKMITALEQHTIGYSRVLRTRRATPWPWSWVPDPHRDLAGDRLEPVFVSNLRYINPTIEIFQHDTTLGR